MKKYRLAVWVALLGISGTLQAQSITLPDSKFKEEAAAKVQADLEKMAVQEKILASNRDGDATLAGAPNEEFFAAERLLPSTMDLEYAAKTKAATVSPEMGNYQLGQPVPSFRTMDQASAAGVNPLAIPGHDVPVQLEKSEPLTRPLKEVVMPYILAAIGFLMLILVSYVLLQPRFRQTRPADDEA